MLNRRSAGSLVAVALTAAMWTGPGSPAQTSAQCAPPAAPDPMPEGPLHDHTDPAQHRFSCGIQTLASLDLRSVIPQPTMFGELDIAGNVLAVATPFPQAGFVLLDVSNPERPEILSHYADTRCETKTDFDCGADVKLTPDGRYAFLALQRTRGGDADESKRVPPGIVTVDVSDPRRPRRVSFAGVPPVGVHMLAYHGIGGTGYVFARTRGLGSNGDRPGAVIMRVRMDGGLDRVASIESGGAHDVSVWDDPADGKTYLALSGAQSEILYFYDVTDPARPRETGRFRPPGEVRGNVWYMHNAWQFRHNGRRFTLTGPELYESAGTLGLPPGHGRVAGPVWMLDTQDQAQPRIVGEWRNPGGHKAGTLVFSPHNSWYAGNGITWTAHYHGGVWVLDWNEALAGRARRPREIGYVTPSSLRRDFVESDAKDKFITAPSMLTRPSIWDVVAVDPVAFASDINGGLVVLRREISHATPSPSATGGLAARQTGRPGRAALWILVALALVAGAAATAIALRRR